MSQPDLHAATAHTLLLCARIATCTDVPGTITRLFLSPATRDVHTLLLAEMQSIGMTTHTDALGNLHGLYPASPTPAAPPWLSFRSAAEESAFAPPSTPALLLGSHIDTVPNAGPYDGILGVALPLALLRALHAANICLPYPIHLVAFSEEEGVRFQLPFLGSRHFTGTLPPQAVEHTDAQGITLAQALLSFRGAAEEPASVLPPPAAFLELHIEQGPVLDSLSSSLGVVTNINGQSRLQVTFFGQSNHAGTTPMHLRQDALAAAAEFISSVEAYAIAHPPLVATVGSIGVAPGATNVIPGMASLNVDCRHPEDRLREAAIEDLTAQAHSIAARRNLKAGATLRSQQPSVPMHPTLQHLLAASSAAAGHPAHPMPSGAGHDAMILAQPGSKSGIPTAMLFLRSPGGLSHHPDESVRPEDVHAALQTLWHFLQNFNPATLTQSALKETP